MNNQSEAFILMILAAMEDVANSADNSVLTQLKTQIEDKKGKMKQVRIVFIPEQMQMDFPKPLETKSDSANGVRDPSENKIYGDLYD